MANIRTVYFLRKEAEVTVADRELEIDIWVQNIRSLCHGERMAVGLDCEWRPKLKPERRPKLEPEPEPNGASDKKTPILQLSVGTSCLIVQLYRLDCIPHSLKSFLSDKSFTFVGVDAVRHMINLRTEYDLNFSRVVDVCELALRCRPTEFRTSTSKPGLKELAKSLFFIEVPKPEYVSAGDWDSKVLDEFQIQFACVDAYAAFRIGHKLLEELKPTIEEFAESMLDPDEAEAF